MEDLNKKDPSADDDKKTETKETKGGKVELTEEQLAQAFEHPRFKELTKSAQELKVLKEKQAKEDEDKLKEKEQYKELVEKKEKEVEALKTQVVNQTKREAVISQAVVQGVRKEALDDVVKLVDLDSVKLDEDGKPVNIQEVMKTLLVTKPYLLADTTKINMGSDTTADDKTKPGTVMKWSEIQNNSRNHAWYEEHKGEIEKAKAEGRIDYGK
jgi:hypothetical protein